MQKRESKKKKKVKKISWKEFLFQRSGSYTSEHNGNNVGDTIKIPSNFSLLLAAGVFIFNSNCRFFYLILFSLNSSFSSRFSAFKRKKNV